METTLVLLKPDAVRRNLMSEIIGRFERRGFTFRGMRLLQLDRAHPEPAPSPLDDLSHILDPRRHGRELRR